MMFIRSLKIATLLCTTLLVSCHDKAGDIVAGGIAGTVRMKIIAVKPELIGYTVFVVQVSSTQQLGECVAQGHIAKELKAAFVSKTELVLVSTGQCLVLPNGTKLGIVSSIEVSR